jgi:hypothetical protein
MPREKQEEKASPSSASPASPASSAPSSAPEVVRSSGGSPLRWLLPLLLVLGVVMMIVWGTRPKPVAVYEPPPAATKTVGQIQEQIEAVKSNPRIPQGDKGRILGFLQGDLQKAKAAQETKANNL